MKSEKPKRKPSYKKVAREFKAGYSMDCLGNLYNLRVWKIEEMIRRALREQEK